MATRSTEAEAVRNSSVADWNERGLIPGALGQRHVPGTGSPLRWFFSGVWLAYLIQPVSELFQHHHRVAWIASGVVLTITFCIIYLLVLMNSETRPRLARSGIVVIAEP